VELLHPGDRPAEAVDRQLGEGAELTAVLPARCIERGLRHAATVTSDDVTVKPARLRVG
jgi:hypothetical protein